MSVVNSAVVQPLRWGFFGAGQITSDFVAVLHSLPKTDHVPIAIAARDLQRAQEFAGKRKLQKSFGDYSKLASDPEIDVIYIGTINSEHYDHIKLSIAHGKHVLCEKPLCLNAWQAKEVVALARERKVFLMEGFWTRFFPSFRYFEEYIKKGSIGDLTLMVSGYGHCTENYRLKVSELGGGAMLNYGVYGIQYATYFFGKPDKIVASGHMTDTGVDATAIVNLLYNEGQKVATFVASSRSQGPIFQAFGPKGIVKMLDYSYGPTKVETPEGTTTFEVPSIGVEPNFPLSSLFRHEAEEVRNCIQNGKQVTLTAYCTRLDYFRILHSHLRNLFPLDLKLGKLESERMPLDESILIAEITDEIRRQLGVVYPQDRENVVNGVGRS